MIVRVDDVLHRLLADRFDLREDGIVIVFELVVDQNDAFAGNEHRDIAAIAFDLVEVVVDLVSF